MSCGQEAATIRTSSSAERRNITLLAHPEVGMDPSRAIDVRRARRPRPAARGHGPKSSARLAQPAYDGHRGRFRDVKESFLDDLEPSSDPPFLSQHNFADSGASP